MYILFFSVPFKESVRVLYICLNGLFYAVYIYNFKQDLRKITHTSIVHFFVFCFKGNEKSPFETNVVN